MKKLVYLLIGTLFTLNLLANIQIFPTRVILSEKNRSTTISLRNSSNTKQTYSIRAVFYRMEKDGSMKMIQSPEKSERSLVKNLRYSPRKVTLGPKEEQVVRLMVKNTSGLELGDYRAHLRVLPEGDLGKNPVGGKSAKMKLIGRVAVSISVFYYKGKTNIQAKMSNLLIKRDPISKKHHFKIELKNIGKHFVIGDIELYLKGKEEKKYLGKVAGISSYIPKRTLQYAISNPDNIAFSKGLIEVILKEPKFLGGNIIDTIEKQL